MLSTNRIYKTSGRMMVPAVKATSRQDIFGERSPACVNEWWKKGILNEVSFFTSLIPTINKEKKISMLLPYLSKDLIEASCDEAGRGCLAGSVYAAAVILPKDSKNELPDDPKQLTEKQRYTLREMIKKEALAWAVGAVLLEEIDEINILHASFLAIHRAINQLSVRPQHLLTDGNRFNKYPGIPYATVTKGGGKYLLIAAASILARTCRGNYTNHLHEEYPFHGWNKNKRYSVKKHRAAIVEHGTTLYHRVTFNLLDDGQLNLNF